MPCSTRKRHLALWLVMGACGCADLRLDHSASEEGDPSTDAKPKQRLNASTAERLSDTDVQSVMGDIATVEGLDSVVPNRSENDTTMFIFQERRSFVLPEALAYDVALPQAGAEEALAEPGDVAAGTRVNVYFVHFDTVGTASKHFSATVAFPHAILGVQVNMKTLDVGDALVGRDDVTYPMPGSAGLRGLELPGDDVIFDDEHTLSVDLYTSTSSDQMRVITAAGD